MLRLIALYAYVLFSLIFLSPIMLWLEHKHMSDYNRIFKVVRRWARLLVKSSGAKVQVTGGEHVPADRAVVFISNHQSSFDIPLFLAYNPIPIGFVAKIEMLKVPVIRTWIKLLGSVFVDRKNIRQGAQAILDGIGMIKGGHSMTLFPEGTRSDTMQPFKAGSFKLATKPQAPIVPVTINGSYGVLDAGISRPEVQMTFHPPVYTEGLDAQALAELPKQVENIIKSVLEKG